LAGHLSKVIPTDIPNAIPMVTGIAGIAGIITKDQ
jgi:hypothetical protein